MSKVPLVILAGGLGTRLREETEFRPKPMVEIGGMPIIWHIMKYYSVWGVREFIICTGYKGEMIKNYFSNFRINNNDITVQYGKNHNIKIHSESNENWKVTVVDTGPLTPTGGRIHKVMKHVKTKYFYCTYGDGVANVNIKNLTKFHLESKSTATMTSVRPLSRFGVIDIDENGRVNKFREKPRMETWINGGFFVFNQEIFAKLDPESTLEKEPLINLAKEGKLSAYKHDGFWQPMDTFRENQYLNELWQENKAEWKIW